MECWQCFDLVIEMLAIEVLHGSENVTSRTGNAPSCRATAGEKCTETVGRINLELIVRVAHLYCELLLKYVYIKAAFFYRSLAWAAISQRFVCKCSFFFKSNTNFRTDCCPTRWRPG